ncbi:hypothetical protein ACJMK2_028558 [Sinanodonta woodiana]|uniref:Uncharacterized protein n=1 Tax=Sinanodonta woodiana TaxID=1069815 RepID=A0ABD3XBB7_SINWO
MNEFWKIDRYKEYWQAPVLNEDWAKLSFATPDWTYKCVVLLFKVQNASNVFMYMMRELFEQLRGTGVSNTMDDLLLAAPDKCFRATSTNETNGTTI